MPDDRPYAYDVDGEKIYAGDLVMIIEDQGTERWGELCSVHPVLEINPRGDPEIAMSQAYEFGGKVPFGRDEIRKVASWPQETE